MRSCLPILLCMLAIGCGPTVTIPDVHQPNSPTNIQHAPADEIWETLAQYVETEIIETPRDIARYVKVLMDNGDLLANDAAKIDQASAFPGAETNTKPLDAKNDAAKLRSLK